MLLNCDVEEDSWVLWAARRSNQSILKEISPEYSLEGLMLKLKLQYFGYLMQRTDSLEKPWCWERLKAGGEGDNRGWDGWMASLTQWTWVWVSSGSWWQTGKPGCCSSWGCKESDTTERLNWTELNWKEEKIKQNKNIFFYFFQLKPNVINLSLLLNLFIYALESTFQGRKASCI